MSAPASSHAIAAPARRPLVPCCGHAFDENLLCRCHVSWWEHQQVPERCRADARRHNCRSYDDADEPNPA